MTAAPLPRFLLPALLSILACASGAGKPNVLLICVDDLKPLLGCYGGQKVRTPHIDKLASRSTLFENAYCNQAVCSPSRNALLTGMRPDTVGIYDLATNFRLVVPDAVTLPQAFIQAGYETSAMGKIFHVGQGNHEDAASWTIPHWSPKGPMYVLPESAANTSNGKTGVRGAPTECADVPDDAYGDGKIAMEAINRLNRAKSSPGKPFFMAVGFSKPHLPFVAPKSYWDMYQRSDIQLAEFRKAPEGAPSYAPQYGVELRQQYKDVPKNGPLPDDLQRLLIHGYHAATSYTDAQVGKVLHALDELGLAGNTIVVLWGDHGWHLGDHGMWCKHTNYEQATRIPFLISLPGAKAGSGTRTQAFAENVDLYPTLCELAGIPVPGKLDGMSLVPALRDPKAVTKDHAIHVYPRAGKLGRAIRTASHRLVEWKVPGAPPESADLELYDYRNDPLEKKNIAAEDPQTVAALRKILARYPEAKPQVKTSANPHNRKSGKPAKH